MWVVLVAKLEEGIPGILHGTAIDPSLPVFELLVVPAVLLPEVAEGLFQIGVIWILYLVNVFFVPGHSASLWGQERGPKTP